MRSRRLKLEGKRHRLWAESVGEGDAAGQLGCLGTHLLIITTDRCEQMCQANHFHRLTSSTASLALIWKACNVFVCGQTQSATSQSGFNECAYTQTHRLASWNLITSVPPHKWHVSSTTLNDMQVHFSEKIPVDTIEKCIAGCEEPRQIYVYL